MTGDNDDRLTPFDTVDLIVDDPDTAEKIRVGRLEEFSVGFDNSLEPTSSGFDLADMQREYSMSFEIDFGSVVNRRAVEELLDGDEYHAVSVTDESKGSLLYHLRDMVHDLRHAGYLSSSDDAGAIVASSQADGDGPTAMQLIRDSFEQPDLDDAEYAVDGVTVYPAGDLPPGMVVAVAVDALVETPPGMVKPFVVRDRRGVETCHVTYVGEA